MPTNPVTAQDFLKVCERLDPDGANSSWAQEHIIPLFDALLSQARQEARREGMMEMDEVHIVLEYASSTDNAKEQKLEWAFIEKLRSEYQGK